MAFDCVGGENRFSPNEILGQTRPHLIACNCSLAEISESETQFSSKNEEDCEESASCQSRRKNRFEDIA